MAASDRSGSKSGSAVKGAPLQVLFLGPPGAGKGTQAHLFSVQHRIPHISTGQMLRDEVASGSALGLSVKATLDRGDLVSDDTMLKLISVRIEKPDCATGFLLDGFPRTVAQARELDKLLATKKGASPLSLVLELAVPDEVITSRIEQRGKGSARTDDDKKVLENRLQVFRVQTAPVLQYYKGLGKLVTISGVGSVEEITSRIESALKTG